MPSFYSDADPPLSNGNGAGFVINPAIWSDGDHEQQLQSFLQNSQSSQPHPQQQPIVSASAMQQLAFELSMCSFNPYQRYSEDGGSPIDYDAMEHRYNMISPTAALLAIAKGVNGNYGLDEDGENQLASSANRRAQNAANVVEHVPVPSSEHVAEIVGRQGCKIKALRAKTNTYIKTPVRGDDPVFVVTGRRDDVDAAKREILSAADHFTQIRASRRHSQGGAPAPGHVTAYVRVPYKVVGLVVGPKGATIKRIQQQTHTYIITPSREKDPTFEVTGLPENVEAARKEIEQHIANRTGVYPSTTIGTPPSHSFDDDAGDVHQRAGLLTNDFHLNGIDTTLTSSETNTPDSTPANGASLFSIDSISAPPYFSTSNRTMSLSSGSNPFSISSASIEQRRASADAYFYGSGYNSADSTATSLSTQQFNAWCAFMNGGGATTKSQGLPIFAANSVNTASTRNSSSTATRFNMAYSHSGSDQDEGVWSVGGESPNSLTVEPLASSCLGSIWSEVVGV